MDTCIPDAMRLRCEKAGLRKCLTDKQAGDWRDHFLFVRTNLLSIIHRPYYHPQSRTDMKPHTYYVKHFIIFSIILLFKSPPPHQKNYIILFSLYIKQCFLSGTPIASCQYNEEALQNQNKRSSNSEYTTNGFIKEERCPQH